MVGTQKTTPSGCACHPSTGGELTILRHDATTPSGCACHPSTGGELTILRHDATTPSDCACHPSTGGELTILRHDATTPSGCACHPSTGGELAVRYLFIQTQHVQADNRKCRLTGGRIYKSAPTTRSAALFCPYGLRDYVAQGD